MGSFPPARPLSPFVSLHPLKLGDFLLVLTDRLIGRPHLSFYLAGMPGAQLVDRQGWV